MPRSVFEHWIDDEGKTAWRRELQRTRWRWFFGHRRARRRLYRSARSAFRRGGTFSGALKKRLDQLPAKLRQAATEIQRGGYRQLCTYDAKTSLAVVPRGIVQADFKAWLQRELADLPQVRDFRGLTERILRSMAANAEVLLFDYIEKGNTLVDENGRGLIVEVDRTFRWRINGADGHYCYAHASDDKVDLTIRRERRNFLATIREASRAQNVYLRRLRAEEIAEVVDAFKLRRRMSAGPDVSQPKRNRKTAAEPVTIDAR
jgi:hypothetical protein